VAGSRGFRGRDAGVTAGSGVATVRHDRQCEYSMLRMIGKLCGIRNFPFLWKGPVQAVIRTYKQELPDSIELVVESVSPCGKRLRVVSAWFIS
jgi:hypothetical protein